MKYQPKVSITQKYSDNRGEHIVTEGRFFLIDPEWIGNDRQPIIISETEEIEVGDWVYHTSRMQIFKVGGFGESNGSKTFNPLDEFDLPTNEYKLVCDCVKILALPEHFSPKHLQAIVDGKMKEGDKVLVKCFRYGSWTGSSIKYFHRIELNQQNHITLFPAKQSLEEMAKEFVKRCSMFDGEDAIHFNPLLEKCFVAGAEWAKKNNY